MDLRQTELQRTVESIVEQHGVPGMVVATWQDGVRAAAAAGVANLYTGQPFAADTGYLTGSITKVWLSTLLMTFVEDGTLDLDQPLVAYAPDVQFGADVEVAKSLTMRHLMNHTSGVDTSDLFVDSREYPDGVEDYLPRIATAPTLTEPGVVSSYNNIGWIVAEIVLRRLTGRTFHELLQERVIEPLGLRRTVFSPREAILHRTAIGSFPSPGGGHEPTPQFMYPSAWAAPGTTIVTTVDDTLTFLRMHLADGLVPAGDARVLSAASALAMRTPTSADPTGPDSGFGLGWMYNEQDGRRVFSHGGGSPGGCAYALISPDDDFALAAFVNSIAGMPPLADLVDAVLPAGPSPLAPPVIGAARTDVDLTPFLGSYERVTQRVEVRPADHGDGVLVRLVPLPDDLVGATFPTMTDVKEFRAVPTSADTLVSHGPAYAKTAFALHFSEPGPDGYQLVYMGKRLARRTDAVSR
ncbi:serine hydrolase domain-containing protein [Jiangella anatolica]|uniref:Beta-lactamase-related domain-containing protein n=1 Tax=Jiangella anatolica TaxID=2670374 RepID=A0A2W2BXY7_9ACTN|nr:serine hydrolase domain-containing protein [Jiangella anatolica]PZF84728.1 hypothetical protein C1I92_07625 [Jiangella anatolica]